MTRCRAACAFMCVCEFRLVDICVRVFASLHFVSLVNRLHGDSREVTSKE